MKVGQASGLSWTGEDAGPTVIFREQVFPPAGIAGKTSAQGAVDPKTARRSFPVVLFRSLELRKLELRRHAP